MDDPVDVKTFLCGVEFGSEVVLENHNMG